jgi:hypothetical protein
VDCWIGIDQEVTRRVVRVAGRLTVAEVPELLSVCRTGTGPLELNLADLRSADSAGLGAIQRVRDDGATLVGTPGYIQLKLDTSDTRQGEPSPPKNRRGA